MANSKNVWLIKRKPTKKPVQKNCKQCNRSFLTKYDKKVFCNNRCKCEWHNQRERARLKAEPISEHDDWQYTSMVVGPK